MMNSGFLSNMVNDGNKEHGLSSYQFQDDQSEVGNSFMEVNGRAYTRTTNEESIKISMGGSSINVPMPMMEISGFRNQSQILHTDSEELFKSWIASEESNSYNSPSIVHRIPQATSRMGREHNHITPVDDENSTNLDQNSFRNVVEREVPAISLYLDKARFHAPQPITRGRPSDLGKDYVTLQKFKTSVSTKAMHDLTGSNINNPKQDNEKSDRFCKTPFGNVLNHLGSFMSQKSSLSNYIGKHDTEDGSLKFYGVQLGDMSLDQNGDRTYLELSSDYVTNDHNRYLRAVDGTLGLNFEGFDAVDEPMGNRVQNMANTSESTVQFLKGRNKQNGTGVRAMDYMTITDDQKPKERLGLGRCGSVTSFDPVNEGEATKKRRVERSKKMADAKERTLTPAIPSDMQSFMKRCENLEKEVRSLKLNLVFMNRKDSEQTKQLEELQIQNNELTEEKKRLLEEIERIIGSHRKV